MLSIEVSPFSDYI